MVPLCSLKNQQCPEIQTFFSLCSLLCFFAHQTVPMMAILLSISATNNKRLAMVTVDRRERTRDQEAKEHLHHSSIDGWIQFRNGRGRFAFFKNRTYLRLVIGGNYVSIKIKEPPSPEMGIFDVIKEYNDVTFREEDSICCVFPFSIWFVDNEGNNGNDDALKRNNIPWAFYN